MVTTGRHPRLPPRVDIPLRPPVPLHAADSARLLGLELLRQYYVPTRAQLLLCHHLSWLQWYVLPPRILLCNASLLTHVQPCLF